MKLVSPTVTIGPAGTTVGEGVSPAGAVGLDCADGVAVLGGGVAPGGLSTLTGGDVAVAAGRSAVVAGGDVVTPGVAAAPQATSIDTGRSSRM